MVLYRKNLSRVSDVNVCFWLRWCGKHVVCHLVYSTLCRKLPWPISENLGEFTYTVATARFSIRADFVIKTDQSFCCRRFEFIRFQSAVVV